jgi:hypothetical protein
MASRRLARLHLSMRRTALVLSVSCGLACGCDQGQTSKQGGTTSASGQSGPVSNTSLRLTEVRQVWSDLLGAMQLRNEKRLSQLTDEAVLVALKKAAASESSKSAATKEREKDVRDVFRRWATTWTELDTDARWTESQGGGRVECSFGAPDAETKFVFKKTPQGWKIVGYSVEG